MIVARLTILFFVLMLSATSIAAVETYTIGVIGTGKMGSAIGAKLASAGHLIVY
jgi:phosphoglycerate dehydrogenase-like enzyme